MTAEHICGGCWETFECRDDGCVVKGRVQGCLCASCLIKTSKMRPNSKHIEAFNNILKNCFEGTESETTIKEYIRTLGEIQEDPQ